MASGESAGDSAAAIRKAGKRLAHFHACGSDRGTPGNDHIDWKPIAKALKAVGYQGDVVIESFTTDVKVIARAAAIWRRIEPTQDEIAVKGLKFLHRTLGRIRSLGAGAGVALNPHTPIEAIRNVIDLVDLLLVMTVSPGFGGQSYIQTMEPKIAEARELIDRQDHEILLEVDGGISSDTIARAANAGADRFVVSSALYRDPGPAGVTAKLRSLLAPAEEGVPA